MQKIIETERLILKAITPEYYDELFSRNNSEEIMNTLGFKTDEELEKERQKFKQGVAC